MHSDEDPSTTTFLQTKEYFPLRGRTPGQKILRANYIQSYMFLACSIACDMFYSNVYGGKSHPAVFKRQEI